MYQPSHGFQVVLGDDGLWYVLTPDEEFDERFRHEKDARKYCLNIEYRETAFKYLEPLIKHFEAETHIEIHFPHDLFRHLYRSIYHGFSTHYLRAAFLSHIQENCRLLYHKLKDWQNENPGRRKFEVDELQGYLSALHGTVKGYQELLIEEERGSVD